MWFNKKKDDDVTLPELPGDDKLPKLPEFPEESLNDISVSSINSKFGMQKSNFSPLPTRSEHMSEHIIAEPVENIVLPRTIEITEKTKIPSKVKNIEPVFVRLDKFKQGLESFEEIKARVEDIEEMLAKIRGTREKEGKELEEWEREIQIIKSRIEMIDNSLFNKLD